MTRAGVDLFRLLVDVDRDWATAGRCHGMDPDLFFPERTSTRADTDQALAVCADCPVKQRCLDYALDNHEKTGVWGGTTGRQRRNIRHRRQQGNAA